MRWCPSQQVFVKLLPTDCKLYQPRLTSHDVLAACCCCSQVLMLRLVWVSEAVRSLQDQYLPHAATRQYKLFLRVSHTQSLAGGGLKML